MSVRRLRNWIWVSWTIDEGKIRFVIPALHCFAAMQSRRPCRSGPSSISRCFKVIRPVLDSNTPDFWKGFAFVNQRCHFCLRQQILQRVDQSGTECSDLLNFYKLAVPASVDYKIYLNSMIRSVEVKF